MKQELSDKLTNMCESWGISPGIECMILELMHDAYHNGWEDGVKEQVNSPDSCHTTFVPEKSHDSSRNRDHLQSGLSPDVY